MIELFKGKALSQVTFDELKNELVDKDISESFFVDYKESIPSKLHKYVASFANSHGGYIFIGIKEDPVTKKSQSFDGIPNDVDQSERVRNLIHGNVSPFPLMEIATIPLPDNDKSIVIIKIPESLHPPHICNDGRVYVRNMDASDPADPIKDRYTLDRLYEKSQLRETTRSQRLAQTITYSRILPKGDSDEAGFSGDVIIATLVYASDLSDSLSSLLKQIDLQTIVVNSGHNQGFLRTVYGGVSLVEADEKLLDSSEWWKAKRLIVAYTDGLIETLDRSKRDGWKDGCIDLVTPVRKGIDLGIGLVARLQSNRIYLKGVTVEMYITGVKNMIFADHKQKWSFKYDHQVIKYCTEIEMDRINKKDELTNYRRDLIIESIDSVMTQVGRNIN